MKVVPFTSSQRQHRQLAKVLANIRIIDCHFIENSVAEYLISNEVANLIITDSFFTQNSATEAIIGAIDGTTTLESIQLLRNVIQGGLIFVGTRSSKLKSTSVCGTNNTADNLSCNGTLYEANKGEHATCVEIDACSPLANECYSTWENLSVAMSAPARGMFEICKGSKLELTKSDQAILIASDVGIQCGPDGSSADECTIKGGDIQFQIRDPANTVIFRGIQFQESTDVSVEGLYTQTTSTSIFFLDCHWESSTGRSAVLFSKNSARILEVKGKTTGNVTFLQSSFKSNVVTESVISNGAFVLHVVDTVFMSNEAGESVIENAHEAIEMNMVAFSENIVRRGIVYVGFETEVIAIKVCGTNNTAGKLDCNGIFRSNIDSNQCLDGDLVACDAECNVIEECFDTPMNDMANTNGTICYSNWNQLVFALLSSGGSEIFTICQGTVFKLSTDSLPLVINASDTTLRCGIPGQRDNNCTIVGGFQQLVIIGDSNNVLVSGIAFVGTTNATAVFALGSKAANASFYDCAFSGHSGIAAIINANPLTFQESRRLGDMASCEIAHRLLQLAALPKNVEPAMSISVVKCVFDNNIVQIAPLTNLGGNVNVANCQFDGNSGDVGGVVSIFSGNLVVTSSCFMKNVGKESGSVLVQTGSVLLSESDNYGLDNTASTDCDGIFLADNKTCIPFLLQECGVSQETSPSIAPTNIGGLETLNNTACFSDWKVLYSALKSAEDGESFKICQDTTFTVAKYDGKGLVPLVITANDISIDCGVRTKSCTFSGGARHIELLGRVNNFHMIGFVFSGASEVSINVATSSPSTLTFESCEWSQNSGNATIAFIDAPVSAPTDHIVSGQPDGGQGDDLLVGGRDLEDRSQLICDDCTFKNNSAAYSIVVVDGVDLSLTAVQFLNNVAQESIISAKDGLVKLTDSCLSGNDAGHFFFDGDISGSGNFAENNQGTNSSAFDFDSDKCVADERKCYDTWEGLSRAVSEGNTKNSSIIYTLCQDTYLEVAKDSPIVIEVSKTSFVCSLRGISASNCVVIGGGIQFHITGKVRDITFKGITFTGATITSIHAGGERTSRAELSDCHFYNNSGLASLLLFSGDLPTTTYHQSTSTSRRLGIADFQPPVERSMSVNLQFCSFQGNNFELAPVAVLGGTMSASNCQFEENNGLSGGIAIWFNGGTKLVDSCFISNIGSLSGSVYADDNSTVTEENNFSESNSVYDGICVDLLIAGNCVSEGNCSGLCVDFSSKDCNIGAPPTITPTSTPSSVKGDDVIIGETECLSTTLLLAAAIQDQKFDDGVEVVFSLCPNTMYEIANPILIDRGYLVVQCGTKGNVGGNCTISGGTSHFRIVDSPTQVTLRGLKMTGTSLVTIQAIASSSTRLTVQHCVFEGIHGSAAVLVYNQAAGEEYTDQTDLVNLKPPSAKSMSAEFNFCQFIDNEATDATIVNIGGSTQFNHTAFAGNSGSQTGTICGISGATVAISSSCFVDNESSFPGNIFLENGSELLLNQNNFGTGNKGAKGCSDIFSETSGNCFDSGSCDGVCSIFEASRCFVSENDLSYSTSAPSTATTNVYGEPGISPSQGNPSPSSGSPDSSNIELNEVSFMSSNAFIMIVVFSVLVVTGGIGTYIYCKKRNSNVAPDAGGAEKEDLIDDDDAKQEAHWNDHSSRQEMKPKAEECDMSLVNTEADFGDEILGDKVPQEPNPGGGFFSRMKQKSKKAEEKEPTAGDNDGVDSFGDDGEEGHEVNNQLPQKKSGNFSFPKNGKASDSITPESAIDPIELDMENQMETSYNGDYDSDMS